MSEKEKKWTIERVSSLALTVIPRIIGFAVFVGETIIEEEWQRYVFLNKFGGRVILIKFPDGHKETGTIDRFDTGIIEVGKGFSFFSTTSGKINLPPVRKLARVIRPSPKKRQPPPIPADALEEEYDDGSLAE